MICIGVFLHIKLFFKSLPTCITRKKALSRFLTSWQTYQRLLSSFILSVMFSNTSMSSTWFVFVCSFILKFSSKFCPHSPQVNGFVSFFHFLTHLPEIIIFSVVVSNTSMSSTWFVFVCSFILNLFSKVCPHASQGNELVSFFYFLTKLLEILSSFNLSLVVSNTSMNSTLFVLVCSFILSFFSKVCPHASQGNGFVSFSDFLTNLPENNFSCSSEITFLISFYQELLLKFY